MHLLRPSQSNLNQRTPWYQNFILTPQKLVLAHQVEEHGKRDTRRRDAKKLAAMRGHNTFLTKGLTIKNHKKLLAFIFMCFNEWKNLPGTLFIYVTAQLGKLLKKPN